MSLNINIPTLFNTNMQRSLGERGGKLGWDGVCRSPPHHFHHTCWWAKTLGKTFFESPVPEWPMSKITISSPLNFFTIPLSLTPIYSKSTFSLNFFHPALIVLVIQPTCICHTDIIPGVDVGVAVYYRYTAEVRENVTNKQTFKFNATILQRLTKNISPKTCQISFPQKYFAPILSKMISSFPIYSPQYQTFIFYTLKTLPRMAQKYIRSLNHIIWDPAYQHKSISMKSLRLWLLLP